MTTLFFDRKPLTQKTIEDVVGSPQQPEQQGTVGHAGSYDSGCGNTMSCSYGTCSGSCSGTCSGGCKGPDQEPEVNPMPELPRP